ncbi:hypothetical protein PISL3812_03517 [Talaromyces islandicus]|uniref:Uncharacterized protein n=1 Tax=Talaromyces islandicus TaxID=28573 RepID=A0A0U1LV30_TALIS|nr:hypothetical protein PISL3812_03517 [Talaromyces islandicus]
MIGWAATVLLSLAWAYASALPHGNSNNNPITTPHNDKTTADGGYVYVTVTGPSTTTYTSTIFSTVTPHPVEKYSFITIIKTVFHSPPVLLATPATAYVMDGLQATTTIYLTKAKASKKHSTSTLTGEYQALDQNAGTSEIVETLRHTIFNTVTATKHPAPLTKFITVTHTTVKTGKAATLLTTIKKVTTTLTSVTATKTVTSMLKLSTQSDGKKDMILWKRGQPKTTYANNESTSTPSLSSVDTIAPRAVPTAPQQTKVTVTKTYIPSITVYTTKTITVSGTWIAWANSTISMTVTATARVGGSEGVEQQINAISIATETMVEPILSTIPPNPPPTSAPPPTTSIKTVDVTEIVTVPNHHTSTVTKTKTHVVTSTTIPPNSVVTKITTIMDSVTISAIYTMFLVQTN